jgi:polysaccharide pyruvyl transferase WcaK-like protein
MTENPAERKSAGTASESARGLNELERALAREKWQPPSPPRFLIDVSTDRANNNGDMAIFVALLRRLRARYPRARVRIITNDPEGVRRLDPTVEPVVVGLRHYWRLESVLNVQLASSSRTALFQFETELRRAAPDAYWALIAEVDQEAALGGKRWAQALDTSDAVILTGGGYFTDAFAAHAVSLLTTLDEALRRGLPVFIVGCGFEPVTDPVLSSLAKAILPRATGIACREGITSPDVLKSFGVSKFTVTGDDAIEIAYEARPARLGTEVGINLRNARYNVVSGAAFNTMKRVLHSFAREKSARLLAIPISDQPSDAEAIRQILPEDDISDGRAINSLKTLLPQIADCRVVVTGSYHAAVFALSMGIPAVCLTASSHYQHKMRGLIAMFNGNPGNRVVALDENGVEDRLSTTLRDAWNSADAERERLLSAARTQLARGNTAYRMMFDRIDQRAGMVAKDLDKDGLLTREHSKALLELLQQLRAAYQSLRDERDFFKYHATERRRVINTLLRETNGS